MARQRKKKERHARARAFDAKAKTNAMAKARTQTNVVNKKQEAPPPVAVVALAERNGCARVDENEAKRARYFEEDMRERDKLRGPLPGGIMKENFSPLSSFVTAESEHLGCESDDCKEDGMSFALMSTARNANKKVESPLDANGFKDKLASITNKSSSFVSREEEGGKKMPRIEILKREMSSSHELEGMIKMRRILTEYISAAHIHDVAVVPSGDEDSYDDPSKSFPRLFIDGHEIGGLDSVVDLEGDGIIGSLLTSSSFTRGFLQAGPCPPEDNVPLLKNAYSAVEELRRSLDLVENRILEQSKDASGGHFGCDDNDDITIQDQEPTRKGASSTQQTVGSNPIRLHHSWDVGGKSLSSIYGSKKDQQRVFGLGECEWPSTQRLVARLQFGGDQHSDAASEEASPVIKDAIKYLSSDTKSRNPRAISVTERRETPESLGLQILFDAEDQDQGWPPGDASRQSPPRKRFRWKYFLAGMAAAPVMTFVASKVALPLLCSAGKAIGRHVAEKDNKGRSSNQIPIPSSQVLQAEESFKSKAPQLPLPHGHGPFLARKTPSPFKLPIQQTSSFYMSKFNSVIQNWGAVQKRIYAAASRTLSFSSSLASRMAGGGFFEQKSSQESMYVLVAPGDSLWTISKDVFGHGLYFETIARQNNIEYPYKISAGQCLEITSS